MDIEKRYEEWCATFGEQAINQGWYICEIEGRDPATEAKIIDGYTYGHRPYELQALADEGIFEDDEEAWAQVLKLLEACDPLALGTLDCLKVISPHEYDAILRTKEKR